MNVLSIKSYRIFLVKAHAMMQYDKTYDMCADMLCKKIANFATDQLLRFHASVI